MQTLKMFNNWSLHELTDRPDQIANVGSSDCYVNKAFDNLSELSRIVGGSQVGT